MARQRTQNAISLFPFLAVLVCTMGALILLLLVTTRRIRHDQQSIAEASESIELHSGISNENRAVATAASDDRIVADQDVEAVRIPIVTGAPSEEARLDSDAGPYVSVQVPDINAFSESDAAPPEVLPESTTVFDLRTDIDRLQRELKQKQLQRQELLQEIEIARQKVAAAEDTPVVSSDMQNLAALRREEARIDEELKVRTKQLSLLQQELDVASSATEDGEGVLRNRESALISLRKLAKEVNEKPIAGTDRTVVEFTNSNGTRRAPVMVNVTEEGYELLPSGIKITKDDMEGFPGNDNPLLSGVLAVHNHRSSRALSVEPYVLLLVRPDGSLPFYTAQRTFTDASVHFGYELLEQKKQIDAGSRDLAEAAAVRDAVLAALNRRSNLYGGLMAEVRQLMEQQKQDDARQNRQARVLPDGRIVMPGEDGDGFDGRFYAGGEAKPQKSFDYADRASVSGRRPPGRMKPTTPAPMLAERAYAENELADKSAGMTDWPNAMNRRQGDRIRSGSASGANPFAGNGDAEEALAPESYADIAGVEEIANGEQTITEMPDKTAGGVGDLRVAELFARPGAISGNLGIGGDVVDNESFNTVDSLPHGGSSTVAGMPSVPFGTPPDGSRLESMHSGISSAFSSTDSRDSDEQAALERFNPAWLNTTGPAAASTSGGFAGDDFQVSADWSETDAATSEMASRTVGTAENSSRFNFTDERAATASAPPSAEVGRMQTPTQMSEDVVGRVKVGPQTADGNGGVAVKPTPASDAQLMMEKFLAQIEQEKQIQGPDPFLLALLKQGQNAQDHRMQGRHPVEVSIDRDLLTIGRLTPVDITGWNDQQILATTLEGLAAEMERSKPANARYALPMVDFLVGSGAWERQNLLAKQLDDMDVPTRSVRNRIDASRLREQSGDPGSIVPATGFVPELPTQDSADPINVPTRQRRMSI